VGNHYLAYETLAVIPEPLEDHPLIAFTATSADPDTMYLYEAMKEPDKEQFLEAMEKEVSAHTEAGNFIIVPRHKVPQGVLVIPAVWQMKRKRRISTREVYKWKARLNFDGSKQVKGVNSSGIVVHHQVHTCHVNHIKLAYKATRLRSGLPAGRHRMR
jgi:hypothetical protein